MRFVIAATILLLPAQAQGQLAKVQPQLCLCEADICPLISVSTDVSTATSNARAGDGAFSISMRRGGIARAPGLTDLSMAAPFVFSKSMVDSKNESALYVSGYLHPTGPATYQKNTVYVTLQHADPSIYTAPGSGEEAAGLIYAKDGVGLDIQVGLVSGNKTGRLFGIDNITTYPSGSDGSGTGAEFKIVNNASNQPYFSTSTSKHGLNLFADGKFDVTSGIWADSANGGIARFHTVLFATAQGIRDNFLDLRQTSQASGASLFKVNVAGDITTRGVIDLAERDASKVGTPPAGFQRIYIDAADHKLKRKDSAGAVVTIN